MPESGIIDKNEFCVQVMRYQDAMYRTARSILQNEQDAEDAVQEAILAAFSARASLRDLDKCRPWLLRIVANQSYDLLRRRKPTVDLSDVQEFLPAQEPDQTERLTLWQAVLSLPPDLRAPVTLFYYDTLPIREISRILGLSESAVKTRLSRGRERLRRLLREE